MMVVAAVMFASALFMSVERDQQGNWGLGALSAFASSESGGGESGGVLCRNFKRSNIWLPDGWISGTWIACCVTGTDMDGCDFSLEHSECGGLVTRPQKPSNC